MGSSIKIDPATGERITESIEIDPATGERISASVAIDPVTGERVVPKTAPPAPAVPVSAFPMQTRIDEARKVDNFASRTLRSEPKPATKDEAIAAAVRYALDDEALAKVLRPAAPDAVTGDEIMQARVKDYDLAKTYVGNQKILAKIGAPSLTPKPLPTGAPADASAATPPPLTTVQTVPTPKLTPEPVSAPQTTDATATTVTPPAPPVEPEEAKLYERAQTLAEAIPSFTKGAVKGATAGIVDPTTGTEGAPGALGQIAGNLAGGLASAAAGPAGPPAFMMAQFLSDLEERGLDPARMADPEILALAATSGLFGGLTPVAFGEKALTRALTGAAIGAAQNVAEEDIISTVTDTDPERLKALILGGAFGAGFGAAFKHNPAVREAVSEKLPEADVKKLDAVVEKVVPGEAALSAEAPRAEAEVPENTSQIPENAPKSGEQFPENAPVTEPAATPSEQPVTVAEEVQPAGVKVPDAPVETAPAPEAAAEPTPTTPEAPKSTEPTAAPDDAEAQRLWREKKTESPYFKKWFGDSKVVDEEGKPLVVYHGTGADFDKFSTSKTGDVGFYFGRSPEEAGKFAKAEPLKGPESEAPQVIPAYVSIKNPAPLEAVKAAYEKATGGNPRKMAHEDLKKQGYDGIIREGEIVAFSPEQVKSAIGNKGTFSPHDPSITDSHPGKPFGSTPEGIVRAPEPDEAHTSARKAYTEKDRAAMGLDEIPSPERHSWRKALDEAIDTEKDAHALAKVILEKPRALNDVETAAMVRRMVALKNQHETALANLSKLEDPVAISEQAAMVDQIEKQFDDISRAVIRSGTEKGRNLAIQKLTLNDNYDLVSVISRAKAKNGKPVTPEERVKLKELTDQIKAKDAEIAAMQKKLRDTEARDAITTRRRSARRPQEVKKSIADLTEQTRRLLGAGCLTG